MKSIKPGRGPSFMGGIVGICAALFGLLWTVIAFSMGAGPFALFGVIFIVIAIVQAVYNFKNATGKNRYSAFDITDGDEEPDPLNQRFGEPVQQDETASEFCPYCGTKVEDRYRFCHKCGKELP